jgi:hypothetical protein
MVIEAGLVTLVDSYLSRRGNVLPVTEVCKYQASWGIEDDRAIRGNDLDACRVRDSYLGSHEDSKCHDHDPDLNKSKAGYHRRNDNHSHRISYGSLREGLAV